MEVPSYPTDFGVELKLSPRNRDATCGTESQNGAGTEINQGRTLKEKQVVGHENVGYPDNKFKNRMVISEHPCHQ